jgi:hypothetical protein
MWDPAVMSFIGLLAISLENDDTDKALILSLQREDEQVVRRPAVLALNIARECWFSVVDNRPMHVKDGQSL